MFDVTKVIPISNFDYWFIRCSESEFKVYDSANGISEHPIAKVIESNDGVSILRHTSKTADIATQTSDSAQLWTEREAHIRGEFQKYADSRPEYMVGKRIDRRLLEDSPIGEERMHIMRDVYESMIAGIYYRSYEEAKAAKLTERCINWLNTTDFYIAPASTVYHDAEPCGLLKHSLRVADKLVELLSLPSFSMINPIEAILTALVHDWCKIDFYESYLRNVKNEETGAWEKTPSYRCKGSNLPFGHGVTSMFIVSKFFKLSAEQALAIRWHMSRWNCAEKELVDLCKAEETYPMIHLLQFADQLAAATYC